MLVLPSCRQVAEQHSENMDEPIRGLKWLMLKLHLMMCRYCRSYGKQLRLTTRTVHQIEAEAKPSNSLKEKILAFYRETHGNQNSG